MTGYLLLCGFRFLRSLLPEYLLHHCLLPPRSHARCDQAQALDTEVRRFDGKLDYRTRSERMELYASNAPPIFRYPLDPHSPVHQGVYMLLYGQLRSYNHILRCLLKKMEPQTSVVGISISR